MATSGWQMNQPWNQSKKWSSISLPVSIAQVVSVIKLRRTNNFDRRWNWFSLSISISVSRSIFPCVLEEYVPPEKAVIFQKVTSVFLSVINLCYTWKVIIWLNKLTGHAKTCAPREKPNDDDAPGIFPSLDNYSSSYWLLFRLTPSLMNLSTCSVIPMTTEGQSGPQSAPIQSPEHI